MDFGQNRTLATVKYHKHVLQKTRSAGRGEGHKGRKAAAANKNGKLSFPSQTKTQKTQYILYKILTQHTHTAHTRIKILDVCCKW